MNDTFIVLKGKEVSKGNIVRCYKNHPRPDRKPFFEGLTATILWMDSEVIALKTDDSYPGWHDLDGELENDRGHFVQYNDFVEYFRAVTYRSVSRTIKKSLISTIV